MAAVRHNVEAFNDGDSRAWREHAADPMPILDVMSPHVGRDHR